MQECSFAEEYHVQLYLAEMVTLLLSYKSQYLPSLPILAESPTYGGYSLFIFYTKHNGDIQQMIIIVPSIS